jgi:ribonuclease P protein component
MLDRAHRLRRRDEFTAAVRGGRRAGRGTLVVHLRLGDGSESIPARAGFIVSRAVGRAVVRNRVRRRLRHLVRPYLAELPAGSALVVRALPAAATASSRRLAADLDAALRAAGRGGAPTTAGPTDQRTEPSQ